MIVIVAHNWDVHFGRPPTSPAIEELTRKLLALIMLANDRGLVVPTKDEWIGLNLLERDDQCPPSRK